ARRYVLEALVSARRCGSDHLESAALSSLSNLERWLCRWASSVEAAEDALAIADQKHLRGAGSLAARSLAITEWKRGRLDRAIERAKDLLNRALKVGHERYGRYAELLVGLVLTHQGEYLQAGRLIEGEGGWQVPNSESRPSLLTTEFLGDIHLE